MNDQPTKHIEPPEPTETPETVRLEMRKTVLVHITVGIVLMILTLWLAALSQLDMSTAERAGIVLGVVFAQACFIGWILMHLSSERVALRRFIGLTIFFVAILFGLTAWAYQDVIHGSAYHNDAPVEETETAPEEH